MGRFHHFLPRLGLGQHSRLYLFADGAMALPPGATGATWRNRITDCEQSTDIIRAHTNISVFYDSSIQIFQINRTILVLQRNFANPRGKPYWRYPQVAPPPLWRYWKSQVTP